MGQFVPNNDDIIGSICLLDGMNDSIHIRSEMVDRLQTGILLQQLFGKPVTDLFSVQSLFDSHNPHIRRKRFK